MKKVLGLDIGVTSVGWGIIDIDENTVIDAGVRLFEEAKAQNNLTRRTRRSARRLVRRRKNRLDDLRKLLIHNGVINDEFHNLENPYLIRVKGLTEKLSNEELATALLHIAKRRGSSLETVEEEGNSEESTLSILSNNDKLLGTDKYVCQIQLEKLMHGEKIRNINNNFRSTDYEKEVTKLLEVQQIDEELKEKIIENLFRRRHFSEGPGSEKSPTIYGRYFYKDGELVHVDLIEKMRGKCSIFKDELRAPKMSYSAELFNLLNDLNNLTCNEEKVSAQDKVKIIEHVKLKGGITVSQLCKMLGWNKDFVSGFRVDKDKKPLLTEFKGYKAILKVLKECKEEALIENEQFLNDVAEVLTRTKVLEERINDLHQKHPLIPIEVIEKLALLTTINGYHSLSFKAIQQLNVELLATNLNQMQIIHASGLANEVNVQHKGKKIYFDEEAILSPVAKLAHREAIKVINKLRKVYGEFDSIIVETTRDKNSDEQKKRIEKGQKYFEEANKKVKEITGEDYERLNAKTRMKVRLYVQQDGKCLYTGEALDLKTIVNDPTAYEIDHIIPISISLDDSINNKVLVTRSANQRKGNLTPYQAFMNNKLSPYTFNEFQSLVLSRFKELGKKKVDLLLFNQDITKLEVQQGFISRNLIDTSYANRLVMNTLTDYFKINNIDTKVHTIRGTATAAFRKRLKLEKDRDKDYSHHAIDALIVASIKKQPSINKMLGIVKFEEQEYHYDKQTGEVIDIKDSDTYFETPYFNFLNTLVSLTKDDVKFSWKIDTKPNRKIADDTLCSTRRIDDQDCTIRTYKGLYDIKNVKLASHISDYLETGNEEEVSKYLMYRHDRKTFEKLIEIVRCYEQEYGKVAKENPFAKHFNDHNEKITKYAKKNNGPVIETLKYTDGTLGNHIDVTKHYSTTDKKVVLLQLKKFRTDFYLVEGIYKFVTIQYADLKQSSKGYYIDETWYNQQLIKKGINSKSEFLFSCYRNDIIEIDNKNKVLYKDQTKELFRFIATNNDSTNKIEINPIEYYEKKRLTPAIGKSTNSLVKYHVDEIGRMFKVEKEKLIFDLSCKK